MPLPSAMFGRAHIGALAIAAALSLTCAACSLGNTSSNEQGAAAETQTVDSEPITSESTDEVEVPTSAAAAADGSDDSTADGSEIDGLPCVRIQFPLQRFASVHGIADDDPDGGLNLRTSPDAGSSKVGTLPSGSVVETAFHSDVKCATDGAGNVWWFVYGNNLRGWANSDYLAEHPDEEPPARLVAASRKDDRAPGSEVDAGPCELVQFPQSNYADVTNIDDDDADGGLNLRTEPSSRGDKVGTLPAGTNVATGFHSDIRCAVDDGGNVWWFVYGEGISGWANTTYLTPA